MIITKKFQDIKEQIEEQYYVKHLLSDYKIDEVTIGEKEFTSKYNETYNNKYIVFKSAETCIVFFTGVYYRSIEPIVDVYTIPCKYLEIIDAYPMPTNAKGMGLKEDIKDIVEKNGFDFEQLIEEIAMVVEDVVNDTRREKGIMRYNAGEIHFSKYNDDEIKIIKKAFEILDEKLY